MLASMAIKYFKNQLKPLFYGVLKYVRIVAAVMQMSEKHLTQLNKRLSELEVEDSNETELFGKALFVFREEQRRLYCLLVVNEGERMKLFV